MASIVEVILYSLVLIPPSLWNPDFEGFSLRATFLFTGGSRRVQNCFIAKFRRRCLERLLAEDEPGWAAERRGGQMCWGELLPQGELQPWGGRAVGGGHEHRLSTTWDM